MSFGHFLEAKFRVLLVSLQPVIILIINHTSRKLNPFERSRYEDFYSTFQG